MKAGLYVIVTHGWLCGLRGTLERPSQANPAIWILRSDYGDHYVVREPELMILERKE